MAPTTAAVARVGARPDLTALGRPRLDSTATENHRSRNGCERDCDALWSVAAACVFRIQSGCSYRAVSDEENPAGSGSRRVLNAHAYRGTRHQSAMRAFVPAIS